MYSLARKREAMESKVLQQFYSDVQRAVTDPIAVASLLHQEDVVGKGLLDEVSSSNKITYSEMTASIMRHVDAAVKVDPKSFRVFLSVLNQFTPSNKVAMRMKQAMDRHALGEQFSKPTIRFSMSLITMWFFCFSCRKENDSSFISEL